MNDDNYGSYYPQQKGTSGNQEDSGAQAGGNVYPPYYGGSGNQSAGNGYPSHYPPQAGTSVDQGRSGDKVGVGRVRFKDMSNRPLLPEDEYEVEFVKAYTGYMFNGEKMVLDFLIASGPHSGQVLSRFYNFKKDEDGVPTFGTRSDFYKDMTRLFPHIALRELMVEAELIGRTVLVKVVTVTKDGSKQKLAKPYSKIETLIKVIT